MPIKWHQLVGRVGDKVSVRMRKNVVDVAVGAKQAAGLECLSSRIITLVQPSLGFYGGWSQKVETRIRIMD